MRSQDLIERSDVFVSLIISVKLTAFWGAWLILQLRIVIFCIYLFHAASWVGVLSLQGYGGLAVLILIFKNASGSVWPHANMQYFLNKHRLNQ